MEGEISQIEKNLFLSDRNGAKDLNKLQALGITHVVNVTEPPDEGGVHNFFQDLPSFTYLRLPLQDSDGAMIVPFFEQAYEFIHKAREQGHGVLVHCQQGVSRSPTIVVAYLMKELKVDLKVAYSKVKSGRNKAKPKQNFLQQLMEFEKHLNLESKVCEEDKNKGADEEQGQRKRKDCDVPLTSPAVEEGAAVKRVFPVSLAPKSKVYSVAMPPASTVK